jgi:hypothetical protein
MRYVALVQRDGLVNCAIQTSCYVNNDAFGQAFVFTAARP